MGFEEEEGDDNQTRFVIQSESDGECIPTRLSGVHVFQDVLPVELLQDVYTNVIKEQVRSWGTYVPLHDNREELLARDGNFHEGSKFEDLSRRVVYHILQSKSIRDVLNLNSIHGVAIWMLSSSVGSAVDYHMDYYELLRIEHNLIVPPIYGGVVHCTPSPSTSSDGHSGIVGGDFWINTNGIENYRRFGYKCKLSPEMTLPEDGDPSWKKIDYKFNQLVLFNGDNPHMSDEIKYISGDQTVRRVIMGFNFFSHDVGALVETAPEHSASFIRRVKLLQCAASTAATMKNKRLSIRSNQDMTPEDISIRRILSNNTLSRIFVLAKREKIKQELRDERRRVRLFVFQMLKDKSSSTNMFSVESLINEIWHSFRKEISKNDAHVYINELFRESTSHRLVFIPSAVDKLGMVCESSSCYISS